MTDQQPDDTTGNLQNRMDILVDQSLVGLMYAALLGSAVILFRFYQYGNPAPVQYFQLACCIGLAAALYLRRYIPTNILHLAIVFLLFILSATGLARFGLLSPALVVAIVLPIIIGSVRGMKTALFFSVPMMVLIIAIGAFYTFGIFQPSDNLQGYMQSPTNWLVYVALYGALVIWGSSLTSKLAEYWRDSVQDLKNAEAETLHEREVVAALQRQQSIVQLSGGVAHDFNNILAAITVNLELAQNLSTDASKSKVINEALNDALDATEKGAALTNSLLSFAKAAVLAPKSLNINDVVSQGLRWIARTVPENIKIHSNLADDLPTIYVDEASVSSALLNMILNSRDAMPDGGKIKIATRSLKISESNRSPRFGDIKNGQYIELTVSDSGTGIATTESDRIFEPFYSTKAPSDGSGLGLAMVQGFMKQTGGCVYLTSEPGSGSTFTLLFPASGEPPEKTRPIIKSGLIQRLNTSKARLVVVEDELTILRSLKRMLTASGYDVRTATNGEEAWSSLCENSDVDLVLSDVVMPGEIQGTDLAQKIQHSNFNIPVILMSGHSFSHQEKLNQTGATTLLNKPIRRMDLIGAIESTLKDQTLVEFKSKL